MCLDQFDDLDNSRLSGRFPLSPEFSFGDENAFSSLTFGSGDEEAKFHLRLELGFPLPGTGRRDVGPAVAIGGVYPTQHPEAGNFTLPDVVLKGPLGDTVMDKRAKRLGTYGLSDQLSGSNESFLTYGKTANRPDIAPYATMLGLKGSQTSFGVVEILSGRVGPGEVPVFAVALTGRFDPAGFVFDLTEQLGGVVPGEVLKLLGICRRCILRGDSSSTGFSL